MVMELEELTLEVKKVDDSLTRLEQKIANLQQEKIKLEDKKNLLVCQIESFHELRSMQDKVSDWEAMTFPWTQILLTTLNSVFKIESFRPLQLPCINALMSKRDVMLIMPTGGGKSLCYQLPAVISGGFALVISPLVSLMEDQLMSVKRLGINCAMINSSSPQAHVKKVHSSMIDKSDRTLKLVYVTPEKIAKSKVFMSKLDKAYGLGRLSIIVIDEVHCASQWGHDFRPDYKVLGILKRQFPNSPLLGLTATATSKVFSDCKNILNLRSCLIFKASYNRPNLFYEVQNKVSSQKEQVDTMIQLIKSRFKDQSGIVYCFSQKDAEQVSIALQTGSISATCYHGGMDAGDRTKAHTEWYDGKMQVIVATVAFGMGIDKSNVRFIMHHSISKSMENYYQESGRAGRDGQPATCILYYKLSDVFRQSTMSSKDFTSVANLYPMVQYCIDAVQCRRALIAKHFGETWKQSDCNEMCDTCRVKSRRSSDIVTEDVSNICLGFIEVLGSSSKRLTGHMLVDKWKSSSIAKTQFSSGNKPSIDKLERVLSYCLLTNILKESFHYTSYNTISYIVPDKKAAAVKTGKMTVNIERLKRFSLYDSSSLVIQSATSPVTSPVPSTVKPSPSNNSSCTPVSSIKRSSTSTPVTAIPAVIDKSTSTSLSSTHSSVSKPSLTTVTPIINSSSLCTPVSSIKQSCTPVTTKPVINKSASTSLLTSTHSSVSKPLLTTVAPIINASLSTEPSSPNTPKTSKPLKSKETCVRKRKRASMSKTFFADSDDDIEDFETPKKCNVLSLRKRKDKGKGRLSLPASVPDDVIFIDSNSDSD